MYCNYSVQDDAYGNCIERDSIPNISDFICIVLPVAILIGSLFCVGLCVSKFVIGWVHFLLVVVSGFV